MWCIQCTAHTHRIHMSKNSNRRRKWNCIISPCTQMLYKITYMRERERYGAYRGSMNGSLCEWVHQTYECTMHIYIISTMTSKIWSDSLFQWMMSLLLSLLLSNRIKHHGELTLFWILWFCCSSIYSARTPMLSPALALPFPLSPLSHLNDCVITTILHTCMYLWCTPQRAWCTFADAISPWLRDVHTNRRIQTKTNKQAANPTNQLKQPSNGNGDGT